MAIETLKAMKEQLISCVQAQLGDISKADAEELGEAVDMIKDLAEAIYYCTITESMEKSEEKAKTQGDTNITYYTTPYYNKMYPEQEYRNMERTGGHMYYPGGNYMYYPAATPVTAPVNNYMYYPSGSGGGNSGGSSGGSSGGGRGGNSGSSGGSSGGRGGNSGGGSRGYTEIPADMMRDPREGKSPMRRRMYMEGKEMKNDTNSQLRELEEYIHELSDDITEMIKDASQEEKATLRQKMTTLANKIA